MVLAVVPSASAPTEFGSITGRVILGARGPRSPITSSAYADRHVGLHDRAAESEIRNVVVYLKGVTLRGSAAAVRRQLRQEHETFLPHVIAITKGSTVDFPNDDPIFDNVFSLSRPGTFDLGRYPRG